ncbi:MAG: hypothetical protein M0R17_02850 [Candidatus Omnitrophica bacterium]|nr:hypothetical protein [Candidatus Omnitrophota bacterium]
MNVFVDFSIIEKSEKKKLKDELETLVSLKNYIYVWSKTVDIYKMRLYCLNIKYNNPDEVKTHQDIHTLRLQKKPYKEISEITKVPIEKLSFYLSTKPGKIWTLDDWIKDYMMKDSSIYSKADFIIDPDQRFVDRFKSKGIEANCINQL